MKVAFIKTGERRYAIQTETEDGLGLEMNPAPGYDRLVPHDLLHLVVEAELGLTKAVFGQVSLGGDAGSFHLRSPSDRAVRDHARTRRRLRKRGATLASDGKNDSARSERASYIAWQTWLSRSSSEKQQVLGRSMREQALSIRNQMTEGESEALDGCLDSICLHLDQLSRKWASLKTGESLCLRWPDLSIIEVE